MDSRLRGNDKGGEICTATTASFFAISLSQGRLRGWYYLSFGWLRGFLGGENNGGLVGAF